MPRLSDRTVDIVLLGAAFFFALGAVIALSDEFHGSFCHKINPSDSVLTCEPVTGIMTWGTEPLPDQPASAQDRDECGIVVWEKNPHCHNVAYNGYGGRDAIPGSYGWSGQGQCVTHPNWRGCKPDGDR